jgi:hypothetical protein
MVSRLTEVSNEAMELPASMSDIVVNAELKSLQDELHASHQLLPHALSLALFGSLKLLWYQSALGGWLRKGRS